MAVTNLVAGAAGLTKYTQMFTTSGTFTLPSGYSSTNPLFARVLVVGGGGGGGGGGGNVSGYLYPGRGGGGGGSGCAFLYDEMPIFANTTVTIGAGGTGGTGSAYGSGTTGTAGGSTYFGDLEAPGGGGGEGGQAWSGSYSYTSSTTGHSRWLGRYRQTYGSYETERIFVPQRYANSGQVAIAAVGGCGGAGGSAGGNGSENYSDSNLGQSAGIFGTAGEASNLTQFQFYEYGGSNTHLRWYKSANGFIPMSQGEAKYVMGADAIANAYAMSGAPGYYSGGGRGRQEGDMWWIPGGGGGGGGGNNTIHYHAGTAGTRTKPGFSGTYGSLTGESAAANTGAGGGGGCGGAPGYLGNGGNGGSGFVIVQYYA